MHRSSQLLRQSSSEGQVGFGAGTLGLGGVRPAMRTWQVQQLDLGIVVVDDAWYAGESGELISRRFRFCAGQVCQQRRLADRWKACWVVRG